MLQHKIECWWSWRVPNACWWTSLNNLRACTNKRSKCIGGCQPIADNNFHLAGSTIICAGWIWVLDGCGLGAGQIMSSNRSATQSKSWFSQVYLFGGIFPLLWKYLQHIMQVALSSTLAEICATCWQLSHVHSFNKYINVCYFFLHTNKVGG